MILTVLYNWDITYSTILLAFILLLILSITTFTNLRFKKTNLKFFVANFDWELDENKETIKLRARNIHITRKLKKTKNDLFKMSIALLIILIIVSVFSKKEKKQSNPLENLDT